MLFKVECMKPQVGYWMEGHTSAASFERAIENSQKFKSKENAIAARVLYLSGKAVYTG